MKLTVLTDKHNEHITSWTEFSNNKEADVDSKQPLRSLPHAVSKKIKENSSWLSLGISMSEYIYLCECACLQCYLPPYRNRAACQ